MNIQKELPALTNFIGAYFHQDSGDEGLELPEMVDAAVAEWERPLLEKHTAEIQRALGMLDLDAKAFSLRALGCELDAEQDGYDERSFLEMVLTRMHARLGQLNSP